MYEALSSYVKCNQLSSLGAMYGKNNDVENVWSLLACEGCRDNKLIEI
jgi:hypothetical protein